MLPLAPPAFPHSHRPLFLPSPHPPSPLPLLLLPLLLLVLVLLLLLLLLRLRLWRRLEVEVVLHRRKHLPLRLRRCIPARASLWEK